jgi:hypothetical protein
MSYTHVFKESKEVIHTVSRTRGVNKISAASRKVKHKKPVALVMSSTPVAG